MPPRSRNKKNKEQNPPIFSHDFFIINHGDIFASILLLVFASSISQWKSLENVSKISNKLLFLNNEANVSDPENPGEFLYREYFTTSSFDYVQAVFYVVVYIVVHCIYQEYFIDKVIKKIRNLDSKKKQGANDSFLLFLWHSVNCFSLISVVGNISGKLLDFTDYPAGKLYPYSVKFFFILQLLVQFFP